MKKGVWEVSGLSIIDSLANDKLWFAFLEHKKESVLSPKIIKRYAEYIDNRKYRTVVSALISEQYVFSIPRKVSINKIRKNKKRIVYLYNKEETYVLKMLVFLLYKYDCLFAPNLYSFRQKSGAKKAIFDLIRSNIKKKYSYKVDIKNYFNSIPVEKLLNTLKDDLNDEKLYNLFYELLTNNKVIENGTVVEEEKGIMAGVPISSFLANYYLKDLDYYFYNKKITYCRYADDIIVFDTEKKVKKHRDYIIKFLTERGLEINTEKEFFYNPGDEVEFLGFSYEDGIIDLSKNSIKKIKGKISRKARALRRWMIKKGLPPEAALKAMNKIFNKKFYGKEEDDLSWKYWFFSTINTDKSLKIVDAYMQDWQRYIVTGKHNKKNYKKAPYELLKKCNYKSLVNEFYKSKEAQT